MWSTGCSVEREGVYVFGIEWIADLDVKSDAGSTDTRFALQELRCVAETVDNLSEDGKIRNDNVFWVGDDPSRVDQHTVLRCRSSIIHEEHVPVLVVNRMRYDLSL